MFWTWFCFPFPWILYAIDPSKFSSWTQCINQTVENYGNIGSLLAGLTAIASVLLLYETLREQQKSNQHNEFESRYFKLLEANRKTADQMKWTAPDGNEYHGSQVFQIMLELIENSYKTLTTRDLPSESPVPYLPWQGVSVEQKHFINIAYKVVFWGLDTRGKSILEKSDANDLISSESIRMLDARMGTSTTGIRLENGGFHAYTGHYFRMLYQSIRYVNEQDSLTYRQKYEYVKMLRAQLSNMETAVLFYDSLSDLGADWELSWQGANSNINKQLITKYNLIGNLPDGMVPRKLVKKFYPNMKFSDEPMTEERCKLKKMYA